MSVQRKLAFLCSLAIVFPSFTLAQGYPTKNIRIVTSSAGGAIDYVARVVAQGVTSNFGQQAIVDNRPSGVIPGDTVAKAPADGYTLLVAGESMWVSKLLSAHVPYDPIRDFAPVILASGSPNILVVHPSLPVKSVKELIALAKGRPGVLNYGSGTVGGSPHLSAELFRSMADLKVVHVPYRGVGPALSALASGEVDFMIPAIGAATSHISAGRLRAIAVASEQPTALMPGLPTISATGLPGYESVSIFCVFAPVGTPTTIIQRLNKEISRDLNSPTTKQRLFKSGMEVVASSPEQLGMAVKSGMAKYGKVIKESGIRVE